jgi:hypothetical protein
MDTLDLFCLSVVCLGLLLGVAGALVIRRAHPLPGDAAIHSFAR